MADIHNILYVHGLGGSKESTTCKNLREILTDCTIYAENFDLFDVQGTQDKIEKIIQENNIGTLIGSSFGAFYVLSRKATPFRVVINPCMSPSKEIPVLDKSIPENVVKELFTLEAKTYGFKIYNHGEITSAMKNTTYGIFGTDDELFSYKEFFSRIYSDYSMYKENMFFVNEGHHKLTKEQLKPAINKAFEFVKQRSGWYLNHEK